MVIQSTERYHLVTSRNVISKIFEGQDALKHAEAELKHPGWRILKVITNYEDVTPQNEEI